MHIVLAATILIAFAGLAIITGTKEMFVSLINEESRGLTKQCLKKTKECRIPAIILSFRNMNKCQKHMMASKATRVDSVLSSASAAIFRFTCGMDAG